MIHYSTYNIEGLGERLLTLKLLKAEFHGLVVNISLKGVHSQQHIEHVTFCYAYAKTLRKFETEQDRKLILFCKMSKTWSWKSDELNFFTMLQITTIPSKYRKSSLSVK